MNYGTQIRTLLVMTTYLNTVLMATDIGAAPTIRAVNGKALSANIADVDYVSDIE